MSNTLQHSDTFPLRTVLLIGGSGTRLWPMSREHYPKQFLPLLEEGSPLQATWQRVAGLPQEAPIAIANEEHRFLVAEQLRLASYPADGSLILEPEGRNTAPAIALAALHAVQDGQDAVLLVLPADHVINPKQAFSKAIEQALPAARAGSLLTFGVTPDYPETGYGYIRVDPSVAPDWEAVFQVEAFVEKPGLEQARQYLEDGNYSWNSGIFLFLASRYIEELEKHRPDILAACRKAMAGMKKDGDFIRIDEKAFCACPAESIDYAVMEQADRTAMVQLDLDWSDIGSWQALWQIGNKDAQGNVLSGDVVADSCSNSYVRSDNRLVAVLGLDDVVVVDTPDAVLVAAKNRVQEVRRIVDQLRQQKRPEAVEPRRVYRPWGFYEAVDEGYRFKVKRISVTPGESLSLQLHHHRAEHWIVVTGTARVTCGDKTYLISENQSTYIPLGVKHRLENPGSIPLELVEVQSGAYLEEDDIVRFDDVYGRETKP